VWRLSESRLQWLPWKSTRIGAAGEGDTWGIIGGSSERTLEPLSSSQRPGVQDNTRFSRTIAKSTSLSIRIVPDDDRVTLTFLALPSKKIRTETRDKAKTGPDDTFAAPTKKAY
jgi:hypothetical protein